MKKTFSEFIDKKGRETKHQLKTVRKLLEKGGFTVDEFLNDSTDPYIFVHANNEDLSFGGVRIYRIGEIMAYRVQKEAETHPYGRAYPLDVEGMFNDLMSETGSEKNSGTKIIRGVVEEFKSFFVKSKDAEKELRSSDVQKEKEDGSGEISVSNPNMDYSTTISNRMY